MQRSDMQLVCAVVDRLLQSGIAHDIRINKIGTRTLWYLWDMSHWRQQIVSVIPRAFSDRLGAVSAQMYKEGEITRNGVRRIESLFGMRSIARALADRPGMAIDTAARSPGLLAARNGIVDLKTGSISIADPATCSFMSSTVHYDPCATSPWFDMIAGHLSASQDGEKARLFLGGACMGLPERRTMVLWSRGTGGHSTLVNAMRYALGGFFGETDEARLCSQYSGGPKNAWRIEMQRINPGRRGGVIPVHVKDLTEENGRLHDIMHGHALSHEREKLSQAALAWLVRASIDFNRHGKDIS